MFQKPSLGFAYAFISGEATTEQIIHKQITYKQMEGEKEPELHHLAAFFQDTKGHVAAPPVLCWKAALPAQEMQEFHQGSHIWKQQLLIPRIPVQAPNVLNPQITINSN